MHPIQLPPMIKPVEDFLSRTLREKPWGKQVSRILAASLAAVDPAAAIHRAVQRNENILKTPVQKIKLDDFRNLYLLAIGKASIPMAVAAADLIPERLTRGSVLTKSIDSGIPECYQEKGLIVVSEELNKTNESYENKVERFLELEELMESFN